MCISRAEGMDLSLSTTLWAWSWWSSQARVTSQKSFSSLKEHVRLVWWSLCVSNTSFSLINVNFFYSLKWLKYDGQSSRMIKCWRLHETIWQYDNVLIQWLGKQFPQQGRIHLDGQELLRVFSPDMPPEVTWKAECFIAVWTPVRDSQMESIDVILEVMLLREQRWKKNISKN